MWTLLKEIIFGALIPWSVLEEIFFGISLMWIISGNILEFKSLTKAKPG